MLNGENQFSAPTWSFRTTALAANSLVTSVIFAFQTNTSKSFIIQDTIKSSVTPHYTYILQTTLPFRKV